MYAMTVLGPIHRDRLGITLPHEHLNCDSSFLCTDSTAQSIPIELVDPAELRRTPMRFLHNLDMRDEGIATDELRSFVANGGSTIVDVTPIMQQSRDPDLLVRAARASGANVIMGSGWYVGASHPLEIATMSIDQLADVMVDEVTRGKGGSGIRPGVLGEIGTGDPLLPGEERVLRASARAQLRTGCPINVHMAAECREVMRVLDILNEEGITDLGRVVISHMDVAIDLVQQREVASRGAMVEYDTFGHEHYPDSRGRVMPSDVQRLEAIATLATEGLAPSILVSQDVCLRSLWQRYGGKGYVGLLKDIQLLGDDVGVPRELWTTLLTVNPARVFAYLTSLDEAPEPEPEPLEGC